MAFFRYRPGLGLNLMLACLGAASAVAQEKAPGRPQPAPEMGTLGFFVGAFNCEGEAFETPIGGQHPIERIITGKMDLGGFWLFMRFEDKDTPANPMPIRGNWQLTYNPKNKNFEALWTDNLGRWFPQTSAGWKEGTIAFTGEFTLNDQKGAVRDIFTKKGDREMVMAVELQRDGRWTPFIELNCRK